MKRLKKLLLVLFVLFISLNIITQIALTVFQTGLTLIDVYTLKYPKKDKIAKDYPKSLIITKTSSFENQGLNQCSAFSTAYLLRFHGIDVDGATIYQKMNHKLSNGYVLPQAINEIFKDYGYQIKMYQGNIEQLKMHLANGKPLIALIGSGFTWQHYVSVIGYDTKNIYLYDSLVSNVNHQNYNRILKIEEFNNYWSNGLPVYENVYYVIE